MKKISSVLSLSTGKVKQLISEAEGYRAANASRLTQWADSAIANQKGYEQNRQLTMQSLWAATRDRIFNSQRS